MIIETGTKQSEGSKVKLRILQVATILLVLAIIAFFLLNYITVPYVVEENYSIDNPYTVFIEYNDTEAYNLKIPYTVTETYQFEEMRPVETTFYVSGRPTFRVNDDCIVEDYDYFIDYVGMPFDENDYDKITNYGYRRTSHRTGIYYTGARICNQEDSRLQGRFEVCHYIGDEIVNCPDWIDVTVFSNRCRDYLLTWQTPFDTEKRTIIRQIVVSKKLMCKELSDEEYKLKHLELFRYLGLDSFYYNFLEPGETILTDSGVLAQPSRVVKDVEYAPFTTIKTRLVTKYRNETRFRKVTKVKEETRHSTIEKTREVTKYNTLLEDWVGN